MRRERNYVKWLLGVMFLSVLFLGTFIIKDNAANVLNLGNGSTVSAKAAEITPATSATSYQIPDLKIKSKKIPNTAAQNFVNNMKIGWNLGNTLDACTDGKVNDELSIESSWQHTLTSQAMIDAVQAAGFNTIRIPISWHNHVSGSNYTISKVWMDRVQEVVDYAYKKGMYVIINIHHDNSTTYYYPTKKYMTKSKKYIKSIWTQVAARFSDYDSHLIFEGMNEPRMVGNKDYEWWMDVNDKSCIAAAKNVNTLNQVFVDAVRNGKGSNNERYLMIAGYDASAQGALNTYFKLPKDKVKNKLIVSVHAYTPYKFALAAPDDTNGVSTFSITDKNSTQEIDWFMDDLYTKYVSKKIPVVIGEFGARDKYGNTQDRVNYSAYFIASGKARGLTCCWWDNNGFDGTGENFGLLDRSTVTWKYEDIVKGLMKYAQ